MARDLRNKLLYDAGTILLLEMIFNGDGVTDGFKKSANRWLDNAAPYLMKGGSKHGKSTQEDGQGSGGNQGQTASQAAEV